MRFIHLSDLHLGKTIYGTSLMDNGDQPVWAERFLELADREKPDAVVIAGDIYDRGQPPAAAARLLNYLITELAGKGIAVLMTAGNHDSVSHLSFLSTLLAEKNVYISRPPEQSAELVHATLEDEHGPVTFWLLPYIWPAMIAQVLEDPEIQDYDTAVRRLLAVQKTDFSRRNVLIAHQNVTAGGQEAERGGSESTVGGIGQVDFSAFDGFDYVALGHIHSSYPVGRETVRYAGTPMAYHFNETRQPAKGPLLVTIPEKDGAIRINRLETEPLHRMREVRGDYETIRKQAASRPWENEYLKIILTDTRITPMISDYLHETARAHGSILMELTSEYSPFTGDASVSGMKDLREKPAEELFADFYKDRNNGVEADLRDLELLSFVGELTRTAGTDPEEDDEANCRKILDFVLGQEASRK